MTFGVDQGLQILTGTAGGAAAGWFMAFVLGKDKAALHIDNQEIAKKLYDAQNARITALEASHKSCEEKFNLLLQHILSSSKGA